MGASDIHIEPQEDRLRIRLRIDGELHPQTEADLRVASALALRLKLMAGLDISEKRLPQDGRFNVLVRGKPVDVRMSTMPIAVRRIGGDAPSQPRERPARPGQPRHAARHARALPRRSSQRVSGMVLVTGPTGSGKTTTLYAALNELNSPSRKIITVEDPVEYRVRGLNQIQVNEKIELSFATVLRSVLRQDPDVILVGEVRDTETAQIGLRAAITGHMVLSTLHVREALSVADAPARHGRAALHGGHGAAGRDRPAPGARHLRALRRSRMCRARRKAVFWSCTGATGKGEFKRGAGCGKCNGSGYRGRVGVYEMLEMTPPLVEAVAKEDLTRVPAHGRGGDGRPELRASCRGARSERAHHAARSDAHQPVRGIRVNARVRLSRP